VPEFLEFLTKITSIAASVVTALKLSIDYAIDHTLKRKTAKTVNEIDALLGRLDKFQDGKPIIQTPNLERYKILVEEDLQARLRTLETINAQKQRRAVRRNEEPKGIYRWLLLYRPEGFDGLMVQFIYYAASVYVVLWLVVVVRTSVQKWNADSAIILVVGLVFPMLALYARSVSLRMKSVGNALRLKAIKHPNNDIGWLRRNLLILKKGDGLWGLRLLYYLFLVEVVFAPFHRMSRPSWYDLIGVSAEALLLAQLFKSDALSRRARSYLASGTRHSTQAT
jgi:hypothetical protein